ncbi:conserved hypothetical protein [Neospora caninum Liverpool]|uniref:Uncharacterized protein n=1 Tax=Neospora caninum (strain Liverpool) TaxID=572307 RepID=F0VD68_NEOCL|nr:conserved hypothetical protein [Neospora caninum Liverpool]CBZ51583.1 conserved hypothetical protein [Neospora caninum Liverpool]CEL65534.1 TPA: hypothetical protein BN1204_013770 [Neospora caninum Liverpool]|eukprot:XP_003881616.1 conserved hypothetical protein [Neospora caninum Liverpool]
MAADLGRFVWRADAKQEGLFYTARALKERQGGSQWRKKKTKKFQHALLAEEKNVAKPELASSSALEAEIKRRCQPGFFVPCRYLLPCQQYMELYQRRAKEEREQPHTDDRRCRCRDTVPVATGGCKRGHPLEMFGVWEYGDCSVCNPHSARFGDDHATHDTVLPGQGSLDRDRAEDGQASTSGTGLSDISWGESFRHPEALARAGAQMEQAESWAGYPRGRYQINVEKPEGSEDDLETFDYDISPKSPSSASIFVDDDTSSHTPRRHRLFTGETADVTNVSGTVGSSGRWRASPAANSRYTGEFGATSSRYGDLSGVEKYTANMQQADFDRFFSLILSCRRLEKNIESQNLQLELYEKGYGQKVIEEVLRTPAVSSGTTAKNEPARKPATQEGRRTILGKCQPPRETALGSKSPANSFRIGAKQAGAPVARQGLQTPQVP